MPSSSAPYYGTPPTTPIRQLTRAPDELSPRFSRLLLTALGSPFLTTSDPFDSEPPHMNDLDLLVDGAPCRVPRAATITRPTSPTPTDFSIVSVPDNAEMPVPASPFSFFGTPIKRPMYPSTPNLLRADTTTTPNTGSPLRSLLPRIWDALSSPSRGTATAERSRRSTSVYDFGYKYDVNDLADDINYLDLAPLDGEEGELIDDEACCFVVNTTTAARVVSGVDMLSLLPPEISLYILSRFTHISDILSCLQVSRTWYELASDNAVWRSLFAQNAPSGWLLDVNKCTRLRRDSARWNFNKGIRRNVWASVGMSYSYSYPSRMRELPPLPIEGIFRAPTMLTIAQAPLTLDWRELYQARLELDRRWANRPTNPHWEPEVMRISGHSDSVYCLEFDSTRIITGSRDKTIKVWSLKTGRLLGTFNGHLGSVLCLKFEKDWEGGSGAMVSGSSDCSVCVWELRAIPGDTEGPVAAVVRGVLRGHGGGVLDLRMDGKWIISCSKDSVIQVWNRKTLSLHRTLRGHDGPVNAVGLQAGRIVSASGDGKMILWDIESGERLRTFEGHERGLACVEFKDDMIASGSNDCKIKIWSASTGECIRTLSGHDSLVRALSFDVLRGRLVSTSYDKSVKVWDLNTGKMVREFRNSHTSHIFDVKFDLSRIVSTSHDQKIVILDFTSGLDASLFV